MSTREEVHPEASPLAGFTPFDSGFIENPYDTFAMLRRLSPVHHVEGLGWLVSRYDDVVSVCRDPHLWSSKSGPSSVADTPRMRELRRGGIPRVDTLLTCDPPEHSRYRQLVSHAFTPRRVALLEARIRELADDLLRGFAGRDCIELVHEYAVPIPLTVIAEQIGVADEDLAQFKRWSDDSVLPLGGMLSDPERERCLESSIGLDRFLAAKVDERRDAPRDDMLSDLLAARLAGERSLDVPELVSILRQFLVAGNETTTKLISSAVWLLLTHTGQLALLRQDPALVPNAVEEALRLESPVQTMFRTAMADTILGGVRLPAGSRVVLLIGSANRDPGRYPNPDHFDVRREDSRTHLGFAHGAHHCVGASLARAEAVIGVDTLLRRCPHLRLAEGQNDFRHEPSFTHRGLRMLHVRLDAL